MSRFIEGTQNQELSKLSKFTWAIIGNNVVSQKYYMMVMAVDFIYQLLILLQLFFQTHNLENLSSYLRLIVELDNKDQRILHIKTISLACLTLGLLLLLIFSFISNKSINKKEGGCFFFKPLTLTLVLLRSFMLTILFLNFFAPLFSLRQQQQTLQTLLVMMSVIVGLISLLPIAYFIALLFNLAIPNNILPWSETSSRPFLIEVFFKLVLTLAYSGQNFSALLKDLMIAMCVLLLIYKIYYRLCRSLIFNNTIFLISLASDTIILHLLLFLEISLFSQHYSILILVLALLPVSVITVIRFILPLARERHATLTGDQKSRVLFANLYIYQQLISQKTSSQFFINKFSIIHSQCCQQYAEQREKDLVKQRKGKQIQNQIQVSEDVQLITGFSTDTYVPRSGSNLIPEETISDIKQSSEKESLAFQTDTFIGSPRKCQKKGKRGVSHITSSQSFDLKDSFADINQMTEQKTTQTKQYQQNFHLKRGLKLLRHLLYHHSQDSDQSDYLPKLLRIYFTLSSLKNAFLAHFELLKLLKSQKSQDYISKIQMQTNALYIEGLIDKRMMTNENTSRIDLGNLIEMNQLSANFDGALQNLAERVEDFWSDLSNEKCEYNIYEQGLAIAESITEVIDLYGRIEAKQNDKKEYAIYMYMAAFYKFVVFKPQEQEFELLKSRQALLFKKNQLMNQSREPAQEKCIIMARIDTQRPMEIEFSNKLSASMTKYSTHQLIGMKINQLMPELFAENHHKFVDRFMKSGKAKTLNIHRELFIRQSTGYVIPVNTYLYLNFQKKTHLVFMFEINEKFPQFEEERKLCAFMLANKNNTITELSHFCEDLCYLPEQVLTLFHESVGRRAQLEDLFCCVSSQESLDNAVDHDIEVRGKYGEYLKYIEEVGDTKVNSTLPRGKLLSVTICFRLPSEMLADTIFIMKTQSEWYGDLEVKIISIKLKKNPADTMKYPVFQSQGDERMSMFLGDVQNSDKSAEDLEYQVLSQSLSSLSSSNSRTQSSFTSFDQFQSNGGNNNKLPKILRIMILIVAIPFLIMIVTSSISIILTYNNLDEAKDSLEMAFAALTRQDDVSKIRFYTRILSMMANGYILSSTDLMPDRATYYINKLSDALNEFKVQQDYLDRHSFQISEDYRKTQATYYRTNGTIQIQNRSVSYASNLYIAYGESILDQLYQYGISILQSNYPDLNPDSAFPSLLPSTVDQQVLYIQTNGLSNLYDNVRLFTDNYNAEKSLQVDRNIVYAVTMTWICLGVTCLCAFLIIPFYGKVQERVYQLMRVFFQLSKEQRNQMVSRVQRFKEVLKLQQNIMQQITQPKETNQEAPHERLAPHVKLSSKQQYVIHKGINTQEIIKVTDVQANRRKSRRPDDDMLDLSHDSSENSNYKDKNEFESTQKQTQAESISSNKFREFRNHIQRKKILQAILIIILTCLLSSYFIIVQVMSSKSFSNMSHSFTVSQLLYKRLICAQDIIQIVRNTIFLNKQCLVNYGQDQAVEYYMNRCTTFERLYQENLIHQFPSYLQSQRELFDSLENGKFCDSFYGQPVSDNYVMNSTVTRVTPEQCKLYNSGIALTGFTNIISTVYKKSQQLFIQYEKLVANGEYNAGIRDYMNRQFAPLVDTLYLIFDEPQFELIYRSKITTQEYFDKQIRNFFLLFSIFITLLVLVICYFVYRILTKLKREILMSNKLLFIIDYQQVAEIQKNSINQYLNRF